MRSSIMESRPKAFIYVAEDAVSGRLKIGASTNPEERIKGLRKKGQFIRLLGFGEGGFRRERSIHRRFAHARISGEWFSNIPEIRDFAERLGGGKIGKRRYTQIGPALKRFRISRDMKQIQAASLFRVGLSTYQRVEAGKGCGDLVRARIGRILVEGMSPGKNFVEALQPVGDR